MKKEDIKKLKRMIAAAKRECTVGMKYCETKSKRDEEKYGDERYNQFWIRGIDSCFYKKNGLDLASKIIEKWENELQT